MAAHKKQYELLPLEKKTRLMKTITEQGHEHFTEEEKKILAQIRSVAATLYERVDLDRPTVESLREHFYKDPTLALAYFYCCSTNPRMAILIPIQQENSYKINFPATTKK
jgi:hypothetical protein